MKIILTCHPAMLNCARSHIPGVVYHTLIFFFYLLSIVVSLASASASFKVYLFNYLVILFKIW